MEQGRRRLQRRGLGGGLECQLNVYWKIADGAEVSAGFHFGPNPRQAAGAVLRYSGVDAADPIGPHATASGNTIAQMAPAIVTTEDDNRVLRTAAADGAQAKTELEYGPADERWNRASTWPFGSGSSYTLDAIVTAGSDACQPIAGDSGAAGWSLPVAEQWVAVSLAIRPPSSSGPVVV